MYLAPQICPNVFPCVSAENFGIISELRDIKLFSYISVSQICFVKRTSSTLLLNTWVGRAPWLFVSILIKNACFSIRFASSSHLWIRCAFVKLACIQENLWYIFYKPSKVTVKHLVAPNPKKRFLYHLAVVFAQSIEARCSVENEDVVGAAPTGDAPTTSEWSKILFPTKVRLILEVLRYINFLLSPRCYLKLRAFNR